MCVTTTRHCALFERTRRVNGQLKMQQGQLASEMNKSGLCNAKTSACTRESKVLQDASSKHVHVIKQLKEQLAAEASYKTKASDCATRSTLLQDTHAKQVQASASVLVWLLHAAR